MAILDLEPSIYDSNKHKSGTNISMSPKIMINPVKVHLGIS
jgi:hypothetical protein